MRLSPSLSSIPQNERKMPEASEESFTPVSDSAFSRMADLPQETQILVLESLDKAITLHHDNAESYKRLLENNQEIVQSSPSTSLKISFNHIPIFRLSIELFRRHFKIHQKLLTKLFLVKVLDTLDPEEGRGRIEAMSRIVEEDYLEAPDMADNMRYALDEIDDSMREVEKHEVLEQGYRKQYEILGRDTGSM